MAITAIELRGSQPYLRYSWRAWSHELHIRKPEGAGCTRDQFADHKSPITKREATAQHAEYVHYHRALSDGRHSFPFAAALSPPRP